MLQQILNRKFEKYLDDALRLKLTKDLKKIILFKFKNNKLLIIALISSGTVGDSGNVKIPFCIAKADSPNGKTK